jgi:hypothetical protein
MCPPCVLIRVCTATTHSLPTPSPFSRALGRVEGLNVRYPWKAPVRSTLAVTVWSVEGCLGPGGDAESTKRTCHITQYARRQMLVRRAEHNRGSKEEMSLG